MDTLEKLQDVFRTVFDDDSIVIAPNTTARDVDAWDSVHHVSLMLESENVFGVHFTTSEMAYLKNVGDWVVLIEKKLKK